jgi:ATP-dependent Clp protease adaptor protein ClpS
MSESAMQPLTQPNSEEIEGEIAGDYAQPLLPELVQEGESLGELCAILIHNDNVTPYDYVIQILGSLFWLSEEIAEHIAWTAHTKGAAVVVVRPRSEAEKLAKVAGGRAKLAGFPLTFTVEPA